MAFFDCPRGHRVASETHVFRHGPDFSDCYFPLNRASQESDDRLRENVWFAGCLAQRVHQQGDRMTADAIVPVPLHRQRRRERGFNQVDLIGRPLAKGLRLPYVPVLLMRSRARPEKHLLRSEERWEAVRGAFAIRQGGQVDNLRILLLDDVMTIGATLNACSRALREAGAKSVLGLAVARAGHLPSSFGRPPVA
jgi:ComF family protein